MSSIDQLRELFYATDLSEVSLVISILLLLRDSTDAEYPILLDYIEHHKKSLHLYYFFHKPLEGGAFAKHQSPEYWVDRYCSKKTFHLFSDDDKVIGEEIYLAQQKMYIDHYVPTPENLEECPVQRFMVLGKEWVELA